MSEQPGQDVVLFGGTGDLVMRKLLPALYQLHNHAMLASDVSIIGIARESIDTAEYRRIALEQCRRFLKTDFDEAQWPAFEARIQYRPLDARDPATFGALAECLGDVGRRSQVYYLSTAPALFTSICRNLHETGLITPESRVVLEKPLGHDLASSRQINDEVGRYFGEAQIYRIDHYLGKESVQNLLALRFGNALFEPLWRREWISDVQITVAEQIGVEQRAEFYDKTGALRDMVQNHLLQLLCIVAMEPPASIDADAVRDEKLKILRALRPIATDEVPLRTVRGQYRAGASSGQPVAGYLEEPGVAAASRTETFVALQANIDTWRWAGVPFYLRTGKRMQERLAEIVINFRAVPHSIFGKRAAALQNNRLVITMQPDESVKLHLQAKRPGDQMVLNPVSLDLDFAEGSQSRRLDAYERLLMDVMRGNLTLFVRRDEQEAAWKWVEPIMSSWNESSDPPKTYTAGTWGPAASTALPGREGFHWHEEL
ncbi:MAG: glucose-6-phosphate dehydrogenase [Azoarcus sp.]|nr:glucose-6-phosphate dehydrogenase [Azoarcus sp.]